MTKQLTQKEREYVKTALAVAGQLTANDIATDLAETIYELANIIKRLSSSGRSRTTARKTGTNFETRTARYLAEKVNPMIERAALHGNKDTGDIYGLTTHGGQKIVVECKDYGGELHATNWIKQANDEARNAEALAGIVVAKKRGVTDPAQQIVLMDLQTLTTLITGESNND